MRIRCQVTVLAVVTLFMAGCAPRAAPAPSGHVAAPAKTSAASIVPTETLPGGGARATVATAGLVLSAEVAATKLNLGEGISVRLTLTNTSPTRASWTDHDLGWGATVSGSTSLDGVSVGLGPGYHGQAPRPLTLESGESTSSVMAMSQNLTAGVYRVTGGFRGEPGPIRVRTPEIVVTIR